MKISQLKPVLLCSLALLSTPALASTQCMLGETCAIPNVTDYVYFPVTANGSYTCVVNAKGDDSINVRISGDNFNFSDQYLTAGTSGTKVTFDGLLSDGATSGQIIVRQVTTVANDGVVMCKLGK